MANPFIGGGHVAYEPGRVISPLESENQIRLAEEDTAKRLAHARDLAAADLLETDEMLDLLDAAIDDQMKGMQLPGGGDASRSLCGSDVITWECYKKARALLQAAPIILGGFDPVQLIFNDKITPRKGPVLFNCRDFDPDKFFEASYDTGDGQSSGDTTGGLDPMEVQKLAHENQKKWALLVLFWNLLWGKPKINPKRLAEIATQQENLTQLQDKVQALAADGKKAEAEALAKKLENIKLPDLIREGRPASTEHCLWEGKQGAELEFVANADGSRSSKAAAVWCTPGHPSEYKNKGIPVMESGFILPLLLGILSLPPKVMLVVLKLHEKLMKKFIGLKKVPVAGKKLYKAWEACTGLIFMPAYYINNIFIEACIWIALKPKGYKIDVGEMDDEPAIDVTIDEKTTDRLDVADTPGGFVPMDCFVAAQEIVNKVNTNAVQ